MVDSPCKNICILDPDKKICLGCYRYMDEIENWQFLSDKDKVIIKKKILIRKENLNGK